MSSNREYRATGWIHGICTMLLLVCLLVVQLDATPLSASPWTTFSPDQYGSSTINSTDLTNDTSADKDLYVIKAVVYEIGILTDAENSTDGETTERQKEVDLSFYERPEEERADQSPTSPENSLPDRSLLDLLNSTV